MLNRKIPTYLYYTAIGMPVFFIALYFFYFPSELEMPRGINSILISEMIQNKRLIAHALGSIDTTVNCNCREAFIQTYEKGYRLFEVDLALTKDKRIVAFHSGREFFIGSSKKINAITHEEFKNLSYNNAFELIDDDDLFQLMEEYTDTYLILDPKEDFKEIMKIIIKKGMKEHPEALSRMIPQIYSPRQLKEISEYPFNDIIYTLYLNNPLNFVVIHALNRNNRITAITMSIYRYNEAFASRIKELGLPIFVHTINDESLINALLNINVGVLTDAL